MILQPMTIAPLQVIRLAELKTVMTGYTTTEKYTVSKVENDFETHLRLALAQLPQPYTRHFDEEISAEDLERYEQAIKEGLSLGCWQGKRLVGLAIAEIMVMILISVLLGRQLMDAMADRARQHGLRALQVETQNTNVPAIRFYRQVGYEIEAIDLSYYTNRDVEDYEVAIFMRRKLMA